MKMLSGLIAALALVGCTDDGKESGEATKGETPIEVGSKEVGGDFKADCFDCAVDGPGAFIETQVADKAFWSVGDTWQVVYLLRTDARTQMQPLDFEQLAKPEAGLTVLDFTVVELGEHTIGGQVRKTATIKITPGALRGSVSQVVDQSELVQADSYTKRIDLVLNDLWQAVSVTEYNLDFPEGRLAKVDPRQALTGLDTAFPYVVPNAYVGATQADLPALPEALQAVAASANPQFTARKYFHFDLKGQGYGVSEHVFWAKGEPWPFLVETANATGVLVSHNW